MCLNDLLSGISLSDLMVIFTMDKYKTCVKKRRFFTTEYCVTELFDVYG